MPERISEPVPELLAEPTPTAAVVAAAEAVAPVAAAAAAAEPDVAPELPPPRFAGAEPELDLDAIRLPESVAPIAGEDPAEEAARSILIYERELETVDEAEVAAALRCEAARLYERIGDVDRAHHHYEAALLADPRSFTALRGLRRLSRAMGDLDEATRYLDAEIGIAGALERRALALHRVDLLRAAGEQDLARVAVGELLDEASGDVRALLAQLELTFLDGRVVELSEALARLAGPLADAELRGAIGVALGHLHERGLEGAPEPDRARAAFASAREANPASAPAMLGARRAGIADATVALAELAVDAGDVGCAAGLLRRAALVARIAGDRPAEAAAIARAVAVAPHDPLVAAEALAVATTVDEQLAALDGIVAVAPGDAMRAWALARQASLRLARGGDADHDAALELLARASATDPSHDHVTAAHEAQLAARGDWAAIAVLARARVAADPGAERDRVTAARALAALGTAEDPTPVEEAVELLAEGRRLTPGSSTLVDVAADALAVAGRWGDRVALWTEAAGIDSEQLDPELAMLRAAAAAEEAVAAMAPETPIDDALRTITAALEVWGKVLDHDPDNVRAHGAAIALARRLGDRDVLADVLARAQASRTGAASATLGLERARAAMAPGADDEPDLGRAEDVLDELVTSAPEDPRRVAVALLVAARAGRWADAALVLEERADAAVEAGAGLEAVTLRYRAAQLLLDQADDPSRAAQLLARVLEDRPQLTAAADALGAVRRRLGDAAPVAMTPRPAAGLRAAAVELGTGADAFARLIRDGEVLVGQGDAPGALAMFGRALELRPGDPLAALPLQRAARAATDPAPLVRIALEELRHAEDAGDDRLRADAYEMMAMVDGEIRDDAGSALVAWESAAAAAPTRLAVLRQLERAYLAGGRDGDLYALRARQVDALAAPGVTGDDAADAVALALDRAGLGDRDGVGDDEVRASYQRVVELDPRQRLALFHLEAIVRRGGSSVELAALEEAIATLFGDDARSRAAFLTRAGETFAELGQLESAIERFRAAEELQPGYVPALQGWRLAALRGGLWLDFAEAAAREAAATTDDTQRGALYHLAGVALMDRALVGERAVPVLRKCLAADPRHVDAFVRLRILLEEQGEHDELARLVEERLVHEDDVATKIVLHRAVAELYRNFLDDRESAKYNYRAILELSPDDGGAVAALSDICWEQGAWGEAAEALVARARLEREPRILRNIYYRLGLIYAERLPQPELALKAFQRVLAYDPDDADALGKLADLAIAAGEWKLALGACERLVKGEEDPARRVAHLHRVGTIFLDGLGDRAKAERAYRMALDGAPESDLALTRLVEFYQNAGDLRSVRVHLDRVAAAMRSRLDHDPADAVAYRVVSRVMAARQGAGVVGSLEVARCAAELAVLTGSGEATEVALAGSLVPGDLRPLVRPEADDLLFPRTVSPELRQVFALLGERVAKHVGVDLRPYGVTRGDRLRARDNPVAAVAQEVADQLGLGEIDVFVSERQPLAMQAEPTSPVSLVVGAQIASSGRQDALRFAAGSALKLAQTHLAILVRLSEDDLAALVVGLLRLFQNDFPYLAVDADAAAAQNQKLRRLIPSGLMNELKPFAFAVNSHGFDHRALRRGLRVGGLRAGVRAAGGIGAGLSILGAELGAADAAAALQDPVIRDLVRFAVGEDHARLVQLRAD
ncbi:MAG: tetratricopeptide repeat protein [Kofleriaceae bacterium]|nr:tetratricopeptide repeat protein [Kofleriaceae bacterium]